MLAVLEGLWKTLSDAGHPSPRWHNLNFELDPQAMTMTLPDSAEATDEEVAVFATRARDLLYIVRKLVEQHCARAEAQQAARSS